MCVYVRLCTHWVSAIGSPWPCRVTTVALWHVQLFSPCTLSRSCAPHQPAVWVVMFCPQLFTAFLDPRSLPSVYHSFLCLRVRSVECKCVCTACSSGRPCACASAFRKFLTAAVILFFGGDGGGGGGSCPLFVFGRLCAFATPAFPACLRVCARVCACSFCRQICSTPPEAHCRRSGSFNQQPWKR